MPDRTGRAQRRDQQAREVEQSQEDLRRSIEETRRLVDESDAMLKRHRRECEEDEENDAAGSDPDSP
jgi:hypothetical protein